MQLGGIALKMNVNKGMMLGFEEGEELEVRDLPDLQGGGVEMVLRQLLHELDDARAWCDGATGEMRLIDVAIGMQLDAIDHRRIFLGGRCGSLDDVV